MARTTDPHSATAQFFINLVNNGRSPHGQSRTAGATRSSATSSRGWTWWTRSARSRPATRDLYEDVPVKPVVLEKATSCPRASHHQADIFRAGDPMARSDRRAGHLPGHDHHRAVRRQGADHGGELPEVRRCGLLRRPRLPPRDPQVHDPGGRPRGQACGRRGRAPIKNEASNGLTNPRGTIAMARTDDPDSATAQFFINLVDNGVLDHSGRCPRMAATPSSAR